MNYLQQVCVVLALLALTQLTKGEEIETPKLKPNKNQNLCKSQLNGAMLTNTNDCHKFYICLNQKPFAYNCNPDYNYDSSIHRCEPGSFYSNDSNRSATCTEGSIRDVKDDCYIFETCIKGQNQKLNCPPNYYFSARQNHCVLFTYDAQFKCNCLLPEYTVLENKFNCETYYVCRKKSAVLKNCPLGQYYNVQLNTCINDLQGVCLMKPTIRPDVGLNVTKVNDVQATCAKLDLKGIHFETFPRDCDTFYICVNGQLYTQHCPKDFYYDPDRKYCITDVTNKCSNTNDLKLEEVKENNEKLKIRKQNKLFLKFLSFKYNKYGGI